MVGAWAWSAVCVRRACWAQRLIWRGFEDAWRRTQPQAGDGVIITPRTVGGVPHDLALGVGVRIFYEVMELGAKQLASGKAILVCGWVRATRTRDEWQLTAQLLAPRVFY